MVETPDGEFTSFTEATVGGSGEGRRFKFDDWLPNRPRNNKEIWRYRSPSQFQSILEDRYLWFSRPDIFDDPYEGSIPSKNAEDRRREHDRGTASARSDFRNLYRYTAFLNCWYSEKHESDAMWRRSADEGDALAIKSTPLKLKKAIIASNQDIGDAEIFDGEIEYVDYDSFKIESENPIATFFFINGKHSSLKMNIGF